MLLMLIFLLLVAAIGYWGFHLKDKKIPKKVIIPFIILSIIFLIFSIDTDDSSAAANYKEEVEKNEQLEEDISELKENSHSLQKMVDELEVTADNTKEQMEALKKENEEFQDKYTSIQSESETLEEEITSLKADNKKLKKEIESHKDKPVSAKTEKKTKDKSESKQENTSSKDDTSTTNNKSEEKRTSTSNDSAEVAEECDIKGSTTGIYHTPGSTYYSRTTNVVEWFCSTEEAENAGYRAPKR